MGGDYGFSAFEANESITLLCHLQRRFGFRPSIGGNQSGLSQRRLRVHYELETLKDLPFLNRYFVADLKDVVVVISPVSR
jgi:hypothetical protein